MSVSEERRSRGYQPLYDQTHAVGTQAELLWMDGVVRSLIDGSAEIKHDTKAPQTGNFYFEYSSLNRDGWQPSGLSLTASDWWVTVVNGVAVAVPHERARAIVRTYWDSPQRRAELKVSDHPTKGVVVPFLAYVNQAIRWETS